MFTVHSAECCGHLDWLHRKIHQEMANHLRLHEGERGNIYTYVVGEES